MKKGHAWIAGAAIICLFVQSAWGAEIELESKTDAAGTTTYWGHGATYEIVGPSVTVFFLKQRDGAIVRPMIRAAYVGDRWINATSVSFTVGERIYGPYTDLFDKPTRIEADSARVESILFSVDSDEKWRMLDAIAEAGELGRPVVAVFEGDSPYGVELDRTAKRATEQLVRGYRQVSKSLH